MKKVFLGGTCNGSKWRDKLIPMLEINYFNPVVADWNEEAYQRELREREECDYCLYVITPMSESVYSIAEIVDDSNKRPDKVIMCVLEEDDNKVFNKTELKHRLKVAQLVQDNGGIICDNLENLASYLNNN